MANRNRPARSWSTSMILCSALITCACGTTPTVAPARAFPAPGPLLVPCPDLPPLQPDHPAGISPRALLDRHVADQAAYKACQDRVAGWRRWFEQLPK